VEAGGGGAHSEAKSASSTHRHWVRRAFISSSYSELSPGGTGNNTLARYGSGTRQKATSLESALGVRRDKAALSSGCKSHPATAPAGSNRSSHGGNEMAEAFG
jgi:hypothetical protein